MPHNNALLYNAALAGISGTIEQCWLIATNPSLPSLAEVIADAIDAAIPTITSGATASQAELLQSICAGVFTGRYPVTVTSGNYSIVANAIAGTFVALNAKLDTLSPDYYAQNWLVTDWYLDGVTGNDNNNGTDPTTPLKTGAALQKRLGTYAIWNQSVTIHIGANGIADPLILQGQMTNPATHLDIIGTPTVIATDVLSAYTPLSHVAATPVATQIKGTAIVDFTPYQWMQLRITNGAQTGWTTWIAKANPAGVGVNTARVSPGVYIDTVSTSSFYATTSPTVGSTFVIETLPSIPSINLIIDGPLSSVSTNPLWLQRQYSIQNISCLQITTNCTGSDYANSSCIIFSEISDVYHNYTNTLLIFRLPDSAICCIVSRINPSALYLQTNYEYCLFGKGYTRASTRDACTSISNSLFQEISLIAGAKMILYENQFFDTTYSGGALTAGNFLFIVNASGANNVYGLTIPSLSSVSVSGLNLLGNTSNCRLSKAPAINLTIPQCLQPDDYAQKGTATLVGGTKAVTVPWWDPTTQKLTFSRNTPSGTIGDLSAPAASRTTAGFTINSTNVLDTSTVDWQISPLGRNIFISPS